MATETTTARPPIARNLRFLKQRQGVTWARIALAVGALERQVYDWQADGKTDPSWPNVVRLAEFFDVPPHYFFADNQESRDA